MPSQSRTPLIEALETRQLLAGFTSNINFQPASLAAPAGYLADTGGAYAMHGNGLTYGWNIDESKQMRFHRSKLATDAQYETAAVVRPATRRRAADSWRIAVPNGTYTIHLVSGDGTVGWGRSQVTVNGALVLDGRATIRNRWIQSTFQITVTTGAISLASGARSPSNRIAFIEIAQDAAVTTPVQNPAPTPQPPTSSNPTAPPSPAPTAINLATLSWHAVAPLPVGLTEAMGEGVNGKLYVFGGYTDASYLPSTRVYCYDPASNTWSRKSDMPVGTTHTGTAVDGQYVYLAGGYPPDANHQWQIFATTAVWRYDTINDTWTALPSLPQARGGGNLAIVGQVLHYFSGSDINRIDRYQHWALDLNNLPAGWVTKAPIPTARNHVGAGALDGKVYAVGGAHNQDADETALSTVERYDPTTDTWTAVASLPTPRALIMSGVDVFAGRLIVGGGETAYNVPTDQVTAYDPATNAWTQLATLPQKRTSGILKDLGDELIFTAGHPGFNSDTWVGTFS